MRAHLFVLLCLGAACGGDGGTDAGPVDASGDAPAPDIGGPDGGSLDTTEIRALLDEALPLAPAGIEGVSLVVYDANDRRVIEETVGEFETDRRVPIASASKLVTGLVLLRLIDAGTLRFDDTIGEVLGWSGTSAANATLDHLGGFVSGLEPESLCLFDPAAVLQDCVEALESVPSTAAPGARFEYGSTHQAVAASMAEVSTGGSWAELFERELKVPLGLTDAELRYYTLPKDRLGDDNPLVAGGMRATMDEYAPILAVLFHRGETPDGERLIASETIDRMGRNGYPDAEIVGAVGSTNFRYSWSSWIGCPEAASPCEFIASPGAFGFTPWVDRDNGYYAILGMESDGLNGTSFSVPLMERVRPLIEALLDE